MKQLDVRQISRLLLGLAILPLLSQAAGKCERLVVTGSPDPPPYLWRDPADPAHLIGASADLFQQVAQELGIKVDVLYGGKRSQALAEVQTGRMDVLKEIGAGTDQVRRISGISPQIRRCIRTARDNKAFALARSLGQQWQQN